eukprot:ctg_39.g3
MHRVRKSRDTDADPRHGVVIGIQCPQGGGKTTLTTALEQLFREVAGAGGQPSVQSAAANARQSGHARYRIGDADADATGATTGIQWARRSGTAGDVAAGTPPGGRGAAGGLVSGVSGAAAQRPGAARAGDTRERPGRGESTAAGGAVASVWAVGCLCGDRAGGRRHPPRAAGGVRLAPAGGTGDARPGQRRYDGRAGAGVCGQVYAGISRVPPGVV